MLALHGRTAGSGAVRCTPRGPAQATGILHRRGVYTERISPPSTRMFWPLI